jgi:hypothetical protein
MPVHSSRPDPISLIATYLESGYAGGQWDGSGINSTAAANSLGNGLGYANSADPGNLVSGTIEIKNTLLGDANLDGVVDGIDFADLAANFNKGASVAAIGSSALSDPALVAFAEANGLMADVPEPNMAGLVTLASAVALVQRRRRVSARAGIKGAWLRSL